MNGGPPKGAARPAQQAAARITVLHWLATALFAASLLTGLRIHASNRTLDAPPGWTAWLPGGGLYAVHAAAAAAWPLLGLAYLLHLHTHLRQRPHRPTRTLNRLLINLLCHGLLLMMASGGVLYWQGAAAWQGRWQVLHHGLAWGLAALVLGHALAQACGGAWPRARSMLQLKIAPAGLLHGRLLLPVAGAAVLGAWAWHGAPGELLLQVHEVPLEQTFDLDGQAAEPAWQHAAAVVVTTTVPGEPPRSVPVTVKAVRQGEVIRFLFQWPDTSASLQHLPLVKTADGWRVEQDGVHEHDERRFYEDKFAVLLAAGDQLAGQNSLQLGRAPPAGPDVHQNPRGYHATGGDERVDVWQWKAVRLAPFGQLDDSHFAAPYPVVPGERRYTVGYKSDPAWSGGYTENWQWLGHSAPRPALPAAPRGGMSDQVVPKRLPRDPAALAPFQGPDAAGRPWGLSWYETLPYDPRQDTYPVGTRMPSVLWKTALEGDRGDVRGQARWAGGTWTLEAARGLRTESPHDLEITAGTCLWVAVFDHAQTRHSYHLRPLRLRFTATGTPAP